MTEDWNTAAADRAKASLESIFRAVAGGESLHSESEPKTDASSDEIARLLLVTAGTFDAMIEGHDVPTVVIKQSILSMLVAMDHLASLPPKYVNADDMQAKIEELRAA